MGAGRSGLKMSGSGLKRLETDASELQMNESRWEWVLV